MDLVLKECLCRRVEVMKAELTGSNPSPLEILLIERIVACWAQVWYADAAAAQTSEISILQGNYLRKRQDSAHRRYLSAITTLAMSRRLLGLTVEASGGAARPSLPLPEPAKVVSVDPAGDDLGERGASVSEDDHAEAGLVLEFGPPRGVAGAVKSQDAVKNSKFRRGRERCMSKNPVSLVLQWSGAALVG